MARSLLGGLFRPAPFGPGDDPGVAPWALPGGGRPICRIAGTGCG